TIKHRSYHRTGVRAKPSSPSHLVEHQPAAGLRRLENHHMPGTADESEPRAGNAPGELGQHGADPTAIFEARIAAHEMDRPRDSREALPGIGTAVIAEDRRFDRGRAGEREATLGAGAQRGAAMRGQQIAAKPREGPAPGKETGERLGALPF